MKPLYCISGPTASGKTAFAEACAHRRGAELANADAFQFYRELKILSNQPEGPWHFLADRSVAEPRTAGDFSREAEACLDQDWIWVGTGLYLGAVLYGLDAPGRKGTPFQGTPRRPYQMTVLSPPRELLYERINRRVETMWEAGALAEAQRLWTQIQSGELSPELPPLKAIGLSQIFMLLRGELSELAAKERWKQETRRLAKRQMTWLRKFCPPSEHIEWVSGPDDLEI